MRKSKLVVLVVGVSAMMMLGGCWSADRSAYKSTPFSPKSVTVVDATTFEAIWTYDIPVGHTLVVDYEPSKQTKSPTKMNWTLYKGDDQDLAQNYPDAFTKEASGSVKLPGGPVKTDVVMRASPEAPGTKPPALESAPAPATSEPAMDEPGESGASVDEQIQQEVESAEQVMQEQGAAEEAAAEEAAAEEEMAK